MHRRVGTSLALVVSALAFVAGCSGTSVEQKLLSDFFRAARLRDSATLGNFATASFEPRTDGVVESFYLSMTAASAARSGASQTSDDAKAAMWAHRKAPRVLRRPPEAVKRFSAREGSGKPVPAKDQALKAEWDKWVADGNASRKVISDAQRKLSDSRGVAELSLSRPNGAMVDATKFDGEVTTKEVLLDASVKPPTGHVGNKAATTLHARRSRTRPAG